jgi:hypothetical protein
MPIREPHELFDEIASALAHNLTFNPKLQGGENRIRAFRHTLRALARFCKLRYEDCQIEERIQNLEPPYISPEEFVAKCKEFFGWTDEKSAEILAVWKG